MTPPDSSASPPPDGTPQNIPHDAPGHEQVLVPAAERAHSALNGDVGSAQVLGSNTTTENAPQDEPGSAQVLAPSATHSPELHAAARAVVRLLRLRPPSAWAMKYLHLHQLAVFAAQDEDYAREDAVMWAQGENRATAFFRSAFALVAGGYLLWAQNSAGIATGVEWNRWISLSIVANALIPLLIANLFFAQGLRSYGFHKYLPDHKLAAWRLGWQWAPLNKFALQSLAMFAVMLPILWFASREAGTRTFYLSYFPVVSSARDWAWLLVSLTLYMACWEWFFRGWLLFSLAQGFGGPVAIVLQAVVFGLAHGNKPPLEMASSFAGGLILGIVAWREKSFVPAFLTHALVHVAWAIMILKS